MLFFPFIFVSVGAFFGWLVVLITRPSEDFRAGTIAAVAFGNSTGMPIILLSTIGNQLQYLWSSGHNVATGLQAPVTDPVVYLSVYLLTYPVIQWVAGGWLLAPALKAEHPPIASPEVIVHEEQPVSRPTSDKTCGLSAGQMPASVRRDPTLAGQMSPGSETRVIESACVDSELPPYSPSAAPANKRGQQAPWLTAPLPRLADGMELSAKALSEPSGGQNNPLVSRRNFSAKMFSDATFLAAGENGLSSLDNLVGLIDGEPSAADKALHSTHPSIATHG